MTKARIQKWLGLAGLALVFMLAIGLAANSAFAGAPVGTQTNPGKQVHASGLKVVGPAGNSKVDQPARPYITLYDQFNNPGTNSTLSQNFETALNNYDSQTADDFVVSGAAWNVNEVDVPGVYFNGNPAPGGPARDFHVYFYSDNAGLPGTLVASQDNQTYVNTAGTFAITVNPGVSLAPGHYWISVQANMDYGAPTAGEWGWTDRTVTSNTSAAWQDPGGGFAGCPTWNRRTTCVANTSTEPDQEFRLLGTTGPTPTFTLTPLLSFTPTPTFTLTRTNTPFPTPTCLPQLVVFDGSKQKPGSPATNTKPTQGEYGFAAVAIKDTPGKAEYLAPDSSFILVLDDGTLESAIGFGTSTTETGALWLNRFSPGSPLVLPYSLQNISIFWPANGPNDPNGQTLITETAKLLIYLDANADGNPADATLLYQQDVTVGVTGTFRTYNINPGIAITQTGDIYAGFEDEWAVGGGYQPKLYPASIDTSVPHQLRSWIAAGSGSTPPDINNLGNNATLATIENASGGQITGNWGIRVTGDDNRTPHCAPTSTPAVSLTPTRTRTPVPPTLTFTPLATPTCLPQLVQFDGNKQKPGIPSVPKSAKPALGKSKSEYGVAAVAVRNNPGQAQYMAPDSSFVLYLDDGSIESGIGYGNQTNNTEAAAIWLNRFSPGAPLQLPYSIQSIGIYWPGQSSSVLDATFITQTATLLVYQDVDGDGNPANAVLLGSQDVTVGVTGTFVTYQLNSPIAITTGPGDLYAGFEDSWATSGAYQPELFPAGIDTSQPHRLRSYLAAMSSAGPPDANNLGNNDILDTIEGASGNTITGNWAIRLNGDDNRAPHCAPTSTPLVSNTPTITRTPTRTGTPTNTATITPTAICPGDWTEQTVYPSPVLDQAMASQGGNLYSFSGVVSGTISANSYKYNPGGGIWTAIASLPSARESASAVSDGTFIYILGGNDSTGTVSGSLWRYDPVANSYITLTNATTATRGQAAAYLGGKIYKIGGVTASAETNVVEVYDIAGGTWTILASYPESVGFPMAVGIGSFVYGAGGENGTSGSVGTYRYDTVGNTWSTAGIAELPLSRWGAASDAFGGKWMLAGGFEGANDDISPGAILWDPGTDTWSSADLMQQPRARMSGASIGNAFYTVGGAAPPFSFAGSTDNQRYINICAAGVVNGHLTWQGIAQPDARNNGVTVTLTLCNGASQAYSALLSTNNSGNFTANTALPDGTYTWHAKGLINLGNSGSLTISGGVATLEVGLLRAGDSNNSNNVNATDFNIVKNSFGKAPGQPGYDDRANFNRDGAVNSTDFNLLKNNFGQAGASQTCP